MAHETEHAFSLPLRGGSPITLRPVEADDAEKVVDEFEHLSFLSRHRRFFGGVSALADDWLETYVHADQWTRVVWCGVDPDDPEGRFLGIGQFARERNDPSIAEWAISVVDSHHKQGLGTILLATLYALAYRRNIKVLRAHVLADNDVVEHWLMQLGLVFVPAESVFLVDMPIENAPTCFANNTAGREFVKLIETILKKLAD